MNLSQVFYEAACRMSDLPSDRGRLSCFMVDEIGGLAAWNAYENLMASYKESLNSSDVLGAADDLGWSWRDFRTFMLLMASEAVK